MPAAIPYSARKRARSDHRPLEYYIDSGEEETEGSNRNSNNMMNRSMSIDVNSHFAESRRGSRANQYLSPTSQPLVIKIIILGDSATGKTAIMERFMHGKFTSVHKPTIAVDFSRKQIYIGRRNVWLSLSTLVEKDEGTQNVNANHFQNVHGIFIVADITNSDSLGRILQWKALVDETLSQSDSADDDKISHPISVSVLVNKIDMIEEITNVGFSMTRMNYICTTFNIDNWFATSAKDNTNVDLAVKQMVLDILKGPFREEFKGILEDDIRYFQEEVETLWQNDNRESLAAFEIRPTQQQQQQQQQQPPANNGESDSIPVSHESEEVKREEGTATCACAIC